MKCSCRILYVLDGTTLYMHPCSMRMLHAYIHSMDPDLLKVTVGYGISHKNTKHADMYNKTYKHINNSKWLRTT